MTSVNAEKQLVTLLSFVPRHLEGLEGITEVFSCFEGGCAMITRLPDDLFQQTTQELRLSPCISADELPAIEISFERPTLSKWFTPLPTTLNKFCDFIYIDEATFRESWKSFGGSRIQTEFFQLNKRIVRTPTDLSSFFPELIDLPSKVQGEIRRGGAFRLFSKEYLIRTVEKPSAEKSFSISIGSTEPELDVATLLLQTYIFLLAL
eukprot:TRINITY_DN9775_c0_g1_i3.p1 TRINITY_DN9775_c0_g1~~TRINITY_DN9775_c0_g1_i3.p1  ORF type:complete len:207 (+),score=44.51 TRINITY_DN9775_c0_g1_i3:330-950(+)